MLIYPLILKVVRNTVRYPALLVATLKKERSLAVKPAIGDTFKVSAKWPDMAEVQKIIFERDTPIPQIVLLYKHVWDEARAKEVINSLMEDGWELTEDADG